MDEDRYYNLGSHDKLFNQIDELTDALASRDAEIDELKQTCIDHVEIQKALREQVMLLRKAIEDAAFRATYGECAYVILICDEALTTTEPKP